MMYAGLTPKYLALVHQMNENAIQTWQTKGGMHTTLSFIVGISDVAGLLDILSSLLESGRSASSIFFKDWETGLLHVTLIDPEPGEDASLKARCASANIKLYSPSLEK